MNENIDPSRLGGESKETLDDLADKFSGLLAVEAGRLAGTGPISAAHVREAYDHLLDPNVRGDIQEFISQALRDNCIIEWLSYGMSVVLFLLSVVLFLRGLFTPWDVEQLPTFIGSSVAGTLLFPALRFAINARRENIAIRFLGISLDRVGDAKTLRPLVEKIFLEIIRVKS